MNPAGAAELVKGADVLAISFVGIFLANYYEASRRFRAVRVPGVALIVRHTPLSS